jgi:hypothetical protein
MERFCPCVATCFAIVATVASGAVFGCGSQQLRLTSPETTGNISYTCTSSNTCYPASMTGQAEGQPDEALRLLMPRECHGHIHEIMIRNADSSSPEIDVTCAAPEPKAPAKAAPSSDQPPVDGAAVEPLP